MNRRKIALGPGAASLILIAVTLALSMLTMLTMISAQSDEALARRSAETREEVYGLFAAGERSMAELDAALAACLKENPEDPDAYLAAVKDCLPEGMRMTGDTVAWTERSGRRTLECGVRILAPGAEKRAAWTVHRLDAEDIWDEDADGFFFDDDFDFGGDDSFEEEDDDPVPFSAAEDDEAAEFSDETGGESEHE